MIHKYIVALSIPIFFFLHGCSGATSATFKTEEYSHRYIRKTTQILNEEPNRPYVVVGTIQVRTSRPKAPPALMDRLQREGIELGADAIIPPGQEIQREVQFSSMNPYQSFYVFDDGRVSIVEARAIRFKQEGD